MMSDSFETKYEKIVHDIVGGLKNDRTQEILSLRFGLKNGRKGTLESIGNKYKITRERIRQIESGALKELSAPVFTSVLKPVFRSVDNYFQKEGGLAREERIFSDLTRIREPHPSWGAISLILTVGPSYRRYVESNKFYSLWVNSEKVIDEAERLIDSLVEKLENEKRPVDLGYIVSFVQNVFPNISKKAICSYLDATKKIDQNGFKYFGLSNWPEINPRGAKDKAYIVLKEYGKPLHFVDVAKLINKAGIGNHAAQPQTVHNELIKDPRFVLVGRGTYALEEWGYQTGTVKDVIKNILKKSKGSMDKEQIIEGVLKDRMVKKNTILINLQDSQYFKKNKEGKYFLVS